METPLIIHIANVLLIIVCILCYISMTIGIINWETYNNATKHTIIQNSVTAIALTFVIYFIIKNGNL